MKRMLRAVLFDAVGTLIFANPPVADVYHRAGQRFGSLRTREEIAARFRAAFRQEDASDRLADQSDGGQDSPYYRRPTSAARERHRWRKIIAQVFDDLPHATDDLLGELWNHFSQPESWALYDDAAAAWNQISESGLTLGIASNFDERLDAICAGLAPLNRAAHVFHSAGIGYPKPSPRFFTAIERQLGLSPDEILLIGDDLENDYRGATAAGWHALHLDRANGAAAPHMVRSLTEATERVMRMGSLSARPNS